MGVYIVTLPQGAYTTQDGAKARIVVADNSTDAIAIAVRGSRSDAAPWAQATAVLVTGSTDFSRFTFGFIVVADSDNALGANKHVVYRPLSTDGVAEIGAGLLAAALAAGLTGTTYNTGSKNVILPTGLNCGKSVITVDAVKTVGVSVAQSGIGGNDFPDVTLTGTSIKPTIDAAAGSAATIRNIGLTPITTGINPAVAGEVVSRY